MAKNPKAAPQESQGAPKEHEIEFERLRERVEKFDAKRWHEGMAQKRKMPRLSLHTADPVDAIVDKPDQQAFLVGPSAQKAKVSPSKNPKPNASFGFVDSHVIIESKESFLAATLVVRFDPKKLGPVVRHSLRLFFWDAKSEQFALVADSRVSQIGDHVYGSITRPGQYAILGVNAHPLVLTAARLICGASALGSALPKAAAQLIDPICKVILCAPDMFKALEDPRIRESLLRVGAELGFPLPPGGMGPLPGGGGGGSICDRCLGTGGLRLPECDIFEEPPPPFSICTDEWVSLGPKNLSGCVIQVHVDPTDSRRIYCAAANGGIWVLDRIDRYPGVSWRPLTDQLGSLRMTAVAVAPSAANVIYIASDAMMHRSDDSGGNWSPLAATSGWRVRKIFVHPADSGTVYAATQAGLQVSTDSGAHWTLQRVGDILDAAFDPLDRSIIYIGVRNEGILKNVTAGYGPWTNVLPWSSAAAPGTTEIKIALGERLADGTLQTDANRTVAVKFSLELFINQRGGRTIGGGWVSKGSRGSTGQLWWDNVLAVDPFDPAVILTGEQELYRTANGGDIWTTVASYYAPHEDQHSIEFDRNNAGVVYLSNDGGVFRSTDHGQTWFVRRADGSISTPVEIAAKRSLVSDLATAEFYSVGVQNDIAVGNLYHSGMIASSFVPHALWQGIEGHAWEFSNVDADPKRIGRFYVFHGQLGRRRYPGVVDASADFINIAEFPPYSGVRPFAVDMRPGSNIILVCARPEAGTGYRLMKTTEGDREPRPAPGGGTPLNQPTWTTAIDNGTDPMVSVAFAPSEPAKTYAISQQGKTFRKDNIDAAGAWAVAGQWAVSDVRQLAVNTLHAERLYAITSNQVGRSIDGGAHWAPVGVGSLPTSEFNSIIVDPRSGTRLFLGADIGVFASPDEGDTWVPYDMGLPNAEVLEIFITGGALYATTYGRGLWRRPLC